VRIICRRQTGSYPIHEVGRDALADVVRPAAIDLYADAVVVVGLSQERGELLEFDVVHDKIAEEGAARSAEIEASRARCREDCHPFSVKFSGEPGIDCGGPGRELVLELAQELVDPKSGLSIPVMREYVIPYPSSGERSTPSSIFLPAV
jgi:hypothetical protein